MKIPTLLTAVLIIATPILAKAEGVPSLINYQGKLYQASGAPVPDGAYKIALSIYDVPTGGTAIWTETQDPVVVKGSAFHALLGSINPIGATIFNGPERYLGVKLGNDPELTPRQKIASVPFAMVAEKATKTELATTAEHATTADTAETADLANAVADGVITATKLSANALLLAYAERASDFSTTSESAVQVPGLSTTLTVPPGGRKVKITVWCRSLQAYSGGYALLSLWDGSVGSGTKIGETIILGSAYQEFPASVIAVQSANPGPKTYNVGLQGISGSQAYISCYGSVPAFILAELL